MNHIHKTENT